MDKLYRFEQVRLSSFRKWLSPHITPYDLAAAGFYYKKADDRVQCFACGLQVHRWEEFDNAIDEHYKWSKNCPFINSKQVGNVPIGADPLKVQDRPRDVCGIFKENIKSEKLKCGLYVTGIYCFEKHILTRECSHFENCGHCQLLLTRTTCDCARKCNHMIDCKYCKVHHE